VRHIEQKQYLRHSLRSLGELLHEDDRQPDRTSDESQSFCLAASSFFIHKLDRIKKSINAQLVGSSYDPAASDVQHTGPRSSSSISLIKTVKTQLVTIQEEGSEND